MIKAFGRPRKWLYLPMEIKVREFESKVLVAAEAAERGYNVVLGTRARVHDWARKGPAGIYFYKDGNEIRMPEFRVLHRLGHRIVVHDEEGLVVFSPEIFMEQRVGKSLEEVLDIFFAWGDWQARMLRTGVTPDKVVPTGHPRFDILRKDLRGVFDGHARALREQYGRMILVNTNFGAWNHQLGPEGYIDLFRSHNMFKSKADEDFRYRYQAHVKVLFESYVQAIKRLCAEFPDHTVIVRPHPVENYEVWEDLMRETPRAVVCDRGTVARWIHAADAVVHTNCTTAIEATAMDTPVFAYLPVSDPEFDSELPNAFSMQVFDEDSLVAGLRETLAVPKDSFVLPDNLRELMNEYLTGMDGDWAATRIMDACDGLDVPELSHRVSCFAGLANRFRIWQQRRAFTDKGGQKFPSTFVEEVQQVIGEFAAVSGRFEGVRAEALHRNLFLVSSDQA